MLKWLFWLLILLVFWGLFRSRSRIKASSAATDASTPMVSCARCRVYLPAAEALREEGNAFCCEEHYAQWKRGQ